MKQNVKWCLYREVATPLVLQEIIKAKQKVFPLPGTAQAIRANTYGGGDVDGGTHTEDTLWDDASKWRTD